MSAQPDQHIPGTKLIPAPRDASITVTYELPTGDRVIEMARDLGAVVGGGYSSEPTAPAYIREWQPDGKPHWHIAVWWEFAGVSYSAGATADGPLLSGYDDGTVLS